LICQCSEFAVSSRNLTCNSTAKKKVNLGSNNDAFFSSDVPFKPAHPLVDRREKDGSKVGKLGVGFANFVHIGRFSKMLNVGCGSVKQFENDVDNLGLAGPWLDKGWLDSVYASVIVTIFERRIKDGLEICPNPQLDIPGKMTHQDDTVGFR
jgi:hypothetical protein